MSDDIRTRVLELLDALGDTEEAVAAKLTELGVTGTRRSCERCPVANHLSAQGISFLGVDPTYVLLPDGQVNTPPAVAEFIVGFDCGEYPELIA